MSVFGEFLRRVRVKSIKLGPVTWDILPSEKMPVPVVQEIALFTATIEKVQAPAPDMMRLNDLIDSFENFDSNPESIYYIGQGSNLKPIPVNENVITGISKRCKDCRVTITAFFIAVEGDEHQTKYTLRWWQRNPGVNLWKGLNFFHKI